MFGVTILAGTLKAAETNPFLAQQKDFNQLVYSVNAENARIAQRGGFSRANFALLDTTLSDEQNIAALIDKNIVPAAKVVCGRGNAQKCAALIVSKDVKVLPTVKLGGVLHLTEELKSWNLSEKWNKDLAQIELAIKEHLGNDLVEYVVGYNDDIELFNLVLISKDRTRAIVLNGSLTAQVAK